MSANPWADWAHLRSVQYRTEANLAARQSVYSFQHPPLDLPARVLDLAAPAGSDTIIDVGCGNGRYLAELARRGFSGRVLGADLSSGMLQAARGTVFAAAVAASGARSRSIASMALLCADATALPLRDGAADVTVAAHMLYHVPGPAAALRELRRVTRPGARVIITLNGAAHLHQLRAAIAAARGADPATLAERITLDDGESLARSFFPAITRHDFVGELRVPDPAPIADYIRSLPGTHPQDDAGSLVEAVLAALQPAHDGHYIITTHAGCLVAHRD